MQIRSRLTFQFSAIVSVILLLSFLAVYFFSADYREDDFYNRLRSKATNTAKILIEVEEVDADLLGKIEKDNPASLPDETITIYNYKNEVLFSHNAKDSIKHDDEFLNKIRLEHEVRNQYGDVEQIGFLFIDQYDRFVVIVSAVDIYGLKKLRNLRTVLIIVFGIGLLLVIFAGFIYSGRALKPILRVVKEVDSITISSLNLRLAEGNGQDEIARLAHTFNNMLARLENAFKMQKNFIANASHELRTPLTAITGQLEVLLLKERNEQEYLKTITSVLEDMKNLNLTSNRLLLLAQASSETAESVFKLHRIDEIAWQVRSEILKRNPNYTVQIEFDMEEDDFDFLEFKGNELLIKTCILNLIENACKYSENHTSKVVIKATKTELQMQFTDEGIGIEKDDLAKIFEPFHRGKNAITYRGHGIGLSLVKRIVELHKGEISINSKLGEGTSVLVKIPR